MRLRIDEHMNKHVRSTTMNISLCLCMCLCLCIGGNLPQSRPTGELHLKLANMHIKDNHPPQSALKGKKIKFDEGQLEVQPHTYLRRQVKAVLRNVARI